MKISSQLLSHMYGILLLFLTQQKILILSAVITGNILFGLSEVAAWIECAGGSTHDDHPITSVLTSAHYTEFALRELGGQRLFNVCYRRPGHLHSQICLCWGIFCNVWCCTARVKKLAVYYT